MAAVFRLTVIAAILLAGAAIWNISGTKGAIPMTNATGSTLPAIEAEQTARTATAVFALG